MLDTSSALLWLTVFSVGFALAGFIYTRRHSDRLDDFLVARNSQNSLATIYTLMATTMGTWILFGPAESAI